MVQHAYASMLQCKLSFNSPNACYGLISSDFFACKQIMHAAACILQGVPRAALCVCALFHKRTMLEASSMR
jgi:hypothetical protein